VDKVDRRSIVFGGIAAAAALGGAPGAVPEARANLPAGARRRGYADGPYGLVHYYDNGAKGLPLLLIHQAPMSARQFDAVYEPLGSRGIRAIGVDMPGFGMSDPTPFVPKVEDWAKAIVPVLDALQIPVADVLGHHTGSLLATELALQYPKRFRRLVLNGPFPITAEERAQRLVRLQATEIDFEYRADGTHLSENFARRYAFYGPGADAKRITRMTVEQFQGFGPFWYGHGAAYHYDHAASLKKLRHRAMILTNTGDTIHNLALRAKEIRPDLEYVELQGGGVYVYDQLTQPWCDAVERFVKAA
jgi:pimeloyl-ACP methyl ester carboxylesterase